MASLNVGVMKLREDHRLARLRFAESNDWRLARGGRGSVSLWRACAGEAMASKGGVRWRTARWQAGERSDRSPLRSRERGGAAQTVAAPRGQVRAVVRTTCSAWAAAGVPAGRSSGRLASATRRSLLFLRAAPLGARPAESAGGRRARGLIGREIVRHGQGAE
eukprot:5701277-Prymnesium_polylepis.1